MQRLLGNILCKKARTCDGEPPTAVELLMFSEKNDQMLETSI